MATLKELSERTGYSAATISRVLNADPTFSVPEKVGWQNKLFWNQKWSRAPA